MTAAERLRKRAESYGEDAARLRGVKGDIAGLTGEQWATIYNTVRDELRECAKEIAE